MGTDAPVSMTISDAQREVRATFMHGFPGQLVSGLLWLVSAALATWSSPRAAMIVLLAVGFFVYPLTGLVLRLLRRPASLPPANPLRWLGMQVAFTLPLNLPIVLAATAHRREWFFPAFMIALGTHYLPFCFLYGMPHWAALAAGLVGGGVFLLMQGPFAFATGAWFTSGALLAFAAGALVLERRRLTPRRSE